MKKKKLNEAMYAVTFSFLNEPYINTRMPIATGRKNKINRKIKKNSLKRIDVTKKHTQKSPEHKKIIRKIILTFFEIRLLTNTGFLTNVSFILRRRHIANMKKIVKIFPRLSNINFQYIG